ncbi:lactate utilization protein [Candidatus Persebacteraceae bacterium Df01]|jgi:L-lactate dehydrogenase complex protein LldF|uniref:Lactate utilization protein n=1 Tax=Candidatus Doriopsillibacter californiensis TaxID=2970740 RepID=A0ABT7QN36_9GAMM|nr:lactate utilization protein [Candidatus Persebacteraceae bacterium Df01]
MHDTPIQFHRHIKKALKDDNLRSNLASVRDKFTSHRAASVAAYNVQGDFESLREQGRHIRNESIRDMPQLLQQFEQNAEAAGAVVLWAKDIAGAQRLITAIAKRHEVKIATKSKSMASEEVQLNTALQEAGVEAVETDLGEFIIQLDNDTPSHIIAPVMHKRRDEVAAIFDGKIPCDGDDIDALTRAARVHLRKKFITADMGISGANFLIADTGSALIVTNEGNGRMVTTLPRVRVTLAGIDKIIPRWNDLPAMLNLLTRSATGQHLTNYVSITTGCQREGRDAKNAYIILLDNGRSALRRSDCRDMLRCIRCGACMNHCPVYHTIGGHAYGSVYMGPMGQVLTPSLAGLENTLDLPHAATMCSACAVVCPVKIPLPDLMRRLRARQVDKTLRPFKERFFIKLWAFCARRPRLYALAAVVLCRLLAIAGGSSGWLRRLPLSSNWFNGRDLAAPTGKTFRAMRKDLGL